MLKKYENSMNDIIKFWKKEVEIQKNSLLEFGMDEDIIKYLLTLKNGILYEKLKNHALECLGLNTFRKPIDKYLAAIDSAVEILTHLNESQLEYEENYVLVTDNYEMYHFYVEEICGKFKVFHAATKMSGDGKYVYSFNYKINDFEKETMKDEYENTDYLFSNLK